MYGEDIDLSWRIRKAGYYNYYLPDVQIIHLQGKKHDDRERELTETFLRCHEDICHRNTWQPGMAPSRQSLCDTAESVIAVTVFASDS
ncbi:MAG: hypothetical protein MZV63_35235 [Marinilabiliales bacterium]|nr:hypothetical protein [Marinilabiliales bacterium]